MNKPTVSTITHQRIATARQHRAKIRISAVKAWHKKQGHTGFDALFEPAPIEFRKRVRAAKPNAVIVAPRPTPRRARQHGSQTRSSAASGDSNSDSEPDPERDPLALFDQAALADLLQISKKTVQNLYSRTPHLLPPAIQIPGARGPRWTPAAVEEWLNNRPRHTPKPIPVAPKNKVGRPRIAHAVKGGAA